MKRTTTTEREDILELDQDDIEHAVLMFYRRETPELANADMEIRLEGGGDSTHRAVIVSRLKVDG